MSAPMLAPFEPFSEQHLVLVAGFLAVCLVLVPLGRRHRGTAREVGFRRGFALLIVSFTVPMQVVLLLTDDGDLVRSLPLQLCDLAWIAAAVALWTRHWTALALVYFWGLTLTVQGIITPALTESFPHPQYFMFWGIHLLTVWTAVYLTFGLGAGPTWRGYRFTVACTAAWAVTVMAFNAVADTNYGYLSHKPTHGSVLDWFGPWPGYVLVEVALVAGIWALMTWPWTASAPRRSRDRASSGVVAPRAEAPGDAPRVGG